NLVQGNFIGTDATGMAAVPNNPATISSTADGAVRLFSTATGNTIGGATPGAGKIISGNGAGGLSPRHNNLPRRQGVQGNSIGVNAAGAPLGNRGHGVRLTTFSGANGTTIGGATAAAGNVIAFNGLTGVIVYGPSGTPTSTEIAILSNSIFANGGLGI